MDIKHIGPNGENEMEIIENEWISAFTFKKYTSKNRELMIITKAYYVGELKLTVGCLTIDKESNFREENGKFYADLNFPYAEYQQFQEYGGEVLYRNGHKLINATVELKKEDMLKVGIVPEGA